MGTDRIGYGPVDSGFISVNSRSFAVEIKGVFDEKTGDCRVSRKSEDD